MLTQPRQPFAVPKLLFGRDQELTGGAGMLDRALLRVAGGAVLAAYLLSERSERTQKPPPWFMRGSRSLGR